MKIHKFTWLLICISLPTMADTTLPGSPAPNSYVNVRSSGATCNGTTDDSAAFQTALNSGGAGSVVVEVPASVDGCLLSSVVTLPKKSTLKIRGTQTITTAGLRFTDSTTDSTGIGSIDCPEGATIALANSANTDVISQTNFASLTSTANVNGVNRATISGCIIDGNKANNASGFGVRLYGRGIHIRNVTVQNAKQDGFWLEGHDSGAFTNPPDDDQQDMFYTRSINNGGDGFNIVTQQGWTLVGVETWGNGSWGIESNAALNISGFNTFLNTTGGCHIKSGGVIQAANLVCTNAAGQGLLLDTGTGASTIASGSFGAPIGIEIRSPNHTISGMVQNCTTGVKFNGGSANMQLTMTNNTTWFDCTSENGNPVISVYSIDATGTMKGPSCWTGAETLFVPASAGNTTRIQFPTLNGFTAGGWSPIFPASNGTLMVPDLATTLTADITLRTVTFANIGTGNTGNGTQKYCSDCTQANPCAASGTGALATRINGAWVCNGNSPTSEHDSCAYNAANLAAAAAFGEFGVTNASTLTADSKMVHDIAGAGTGTFVTKLCSDGTTCAGGNVYLTCTSGATCAAAVAGRRDACTVTKSAVPAGTTLTWSVGTACGTTDPGVNICAHMTTP